MDTKRHLNSKNKAIVLGLYLPGIDALRTFHKNNIPCEGYDFQVDSIGFSLRQIKTSLCPNSLTNPNEWLCFMLNVGQKSKSKSVIINTSDKFVEVLARFYVELKEYYFLHYSPGDTVKLLANKKTLIDIAASYNIPTPKTIYSTNVDIDDKQLKRLKYPCLIRPVHGNTWKYIPEINDKVGDIKLLKINNKEELEYWYNYLKKYDRNLIIQEMIQGKDSNLYYTVIYMSRNKDCLGYFTGQKIRVTPIHFGSATYMKIVNDDFLVEQSVKMLQGQGYWGPAGVEFKKNDDDGLNYIIEVNTRFGLWDIMGAKLGVDLYMIAYKDLLGVPLKMETPQKKNLKWISISRDIGTFIEYKNEGLLTYFTWIKSYFGKVYFSDFYLFQPKIMYLLYVKRVLNKLICKVLL
jgi:predicted ATP-grasp superfamily ATP-dependent carboligase